MFSTIFTRAMQSDNKNDIKFRQIWESARDGMRLTDEKGIIHDVNPAFCDLIQLPRERLVGKPLSVIYKNDQERILRKHCERFKSRTISPYILNKYILHNGEIRWFEVYNTYIKIPGEPELVLAVFRDKTDLIETIEALKENEERLNIAVKGANIGLWDQDFRTQTVIRNKIWAEMLGYNPAEIGEGLIDYETRIHPDDREEVLKLLDAHKKGETDNFRVVHRLRCADGSWKWILNVGQIVERDKDGKPLRAAGIHFDIDAQKRAEESLKASETLFHSVWEHSNDGMRLTDEKGMMIKVNNAFCEIVGKKRSELEGQLLGVIYAPHEQQRIVNGYKENVAQKKIKPYIERPYILWDGTQKWFGVSIAFIHNSLVLSVFRDITERVKDHESLRQMVQQKEILMKELQHRVKNNLNIISNIIFLEMRQVKDPDVRNIFINIRNRIQSMVTIYDQFNLSEDMEMILLDKYLKTLGDCILEILTSYSGRIVLNATIEPIALDTNRAVSVGLILNEVITNAVKYAYTSDEKGEIDLTVYSDGEEIIFKVKDYGKGLPPDFSFENLKGMGLLLITNLAKQLQGTVNMKRDNGTTFILRFPK
ncbi:MAG: PAS domain S-box protein [Candidatus Marinimicrobia bacterium]|nr:PAS domain S-box protein [Candidatus Neomarinimicrobiota bacterium]